MGASAARAAGVRTVPGAARRRARRPGRPGAGSGQDGLPLPPPATPPPPGPSASRPWSAPGAASAGDSASRAPCSRGESTATASTRTSGRRAIFGAQLVRQRSAAGVESVFGNVYPEHLGISTTPTLSAQDAFARVVAIAGREPIASRLPELVVLPREDGTFRLTWLSRVRTSDDMVALFVDAKTGEEVWRYTLIDRQSAVVGTGTGVLGDCKKLSTRQASSAFLSAYALRLPTPITDDLKEVTAACWKSWTALPIRRSRTSPRTPTTPGPMAPTWTPTPTSASPTTTTSSASAAAAWTAQLRDPGPIRPPRAARGSVVAAGLHHRQLPAQRVLVRRVRPARAGLHGVRRGHSDALLAERAELSTTSPPASTSSRTSSRTRSPSSRRT